MNTSQKSRNSNMQQAFSLLEVLLATIVLALGLVGVGAVFPTVIGLQKQANEQTMGLMLAENADGLLASRLERFAQTLQPVPANRGWHRINSFEPQEGEPYLQMPRTLDGVPRGVDLRLQEAERLVFMPNASGVGTVPLQTPPNALRGPLDYQSVESLNIRVTIRLGFSNDTEEFVLQPEPPVGARPSTRLEVVEGSPTRFDAGGPNNIDYLQAEVDFNAVLFNANERVLRVDINYVWLNDRIVSHGDRLHPAENPRFAWDMAFRKTPSGQVQYCIFTYRFDGPTGQEFLPDIPNNYRDQLRGHLRLDRAVVRYDRQDNTFYIRGTEAGTDLRRNLDRNVHLLPVLGTSPVRIVRAFPDPGNPDNETRYELDVPPMRINAQTGRSEPMVGTEVDLWYVPLEIRANDRRGQPVTWRLTPISATVSTVKE